MATTVTKAETKIPKFLREASRLMPPLDGWVMDHEQSGGWRWDHPTAKMSIYASPFWDGLAGIPVEVAPDDENPIVSAFVPFAISGDMEEDIAAYREAIRPYLKLRLGHDAFAGMEATE
jgi:hypothetical protein